jgi:hypothetical protein
MNENINHNYTNLIEEINERVNKQPIVELTLSALIEEIIMTQKAQTLLDQNIN